MTKVLSGGICGPSLPLVGSRVPLTRMLHDNGFGGCDVFVRGLYGDPERKYFCSFGAYPPTQFVPTKLPSRSLGWLEKRLKAWDTVWPDAQWSIELQWPYQSEVWERQAQGQWVVVKTGQGVV